MKGNSNKYLILGIVVLAVGITMLITKAVSRPVACGDIVLAFLFFAMAMRKDSGDKDE